MKEPHREIRYGALFRLAFTLYEYRVITPIQQCLCFAKIPPQELILSGTRVIELAMTQSFLKMTVHWGSMIPGLSSTRRDPTEFHAVLISATTLRYNSVYAPLRIPR